jgi:hypothetical protein
MLQVGLISDDLECYAEYLVMQLSPRYEWWKMHRVQLPLVGSRPPQWKQVVSTLVQLVYTCVALLLCQLIELMIRRMNLTCRLSRQSHALYGTLRE